MIAKSVTAVIVSMSAAAGVVWFGTPAAAEHPHRTERPSAKETIDHMVDGDREVSEPKDAEPEKQSRVVVSGDERADDTTDLPKAKSDSDDTQSSAARWMEKYLSERTRDAETERSADMDVDVEMEAPDAKTMKTEKEVRVRVITKDGETTIERFVDEMGEAGKVSERREVSAFPFEVESDDIQIVVKRLQDGESMAEALGGLDLAMEDGAKVMVKPEPMPKIEMDVEIVAEEMPSMTPTPPAAPSAGMGSWLKTYEKAEPAKLIAATEEIEDEGLRDQALFSIVTYALRFDDFKSANRALGMMDEATLSNTAIARIAVRHAELGDIPKALSVIKTIDDEELQDIIRVQMIETLTTPLETRVER